MIDVSTNVINSSLSHNHYKHSHIHIPVFVLITLPYYVVIRGHDLSTNGELVVWVGGFLETQFVFPSEDLFKENNKLGGRLCPKSQPPPQPTRY